MRDSSLLGRFALLLLCSASPILGSDAAEDGKPDWSPLNFVRGVEKTADAVARLDERVVVLEFWATWCTPCIAQLPHTNALVRQMADKPIEFVHVTDEEEPVVELFLGKYEMAGIVATDAQRTLFDKYRVAGLPFAVILDRDGTILGKISPHEIHEGLLDAAIEGRPIAALDLPTLPPETGSEGLGVELFDFSIRVVDWQEHRKSREGRTTHSAGRESFVGVGLSWNQMIGQAYDVEPQRVRTSFGAPMSKVYDVTIRSGEGTRAWAWREHLQRALHSLFGVTARKVERPMPVLLLRRGDEEPKLAPPTLPARLSTGGARVGLTSGTTESLRYGLEMTLRRPVVDEVEIEELFDCELTWKYDDPTSVHTAIREQLGLELVEEQRPFEMLIVDREIERENP